MREHHPAPLALAPPQPQQLEQLRREHGVAIPRALARSTRISMRVAVDVVDLEVRDLRTRAGPRHRRRRVRPCT